MKILKCTVLAAALSEGMLLNKMMSTSNNSADVTNLRAEAETACKAAAKKPDAEVIDLPEQPLDAVSDAPDRRELCAKACQAITKTTGEAIIDPESLWCVEAHGYKIMEDKNLDDGRKKVREEVKSKCVPKDDKSADQCKTACDAAAKLGLKVDSDEDLKAKCKAAKADAHTKDNALAAAKDFCKMQAEVDSKKSDNEKRVNHEKCHEECAIALHNGATAKEMTDVECSFAHFMPKDEDRHDHQEFAELIKKCFPENRNDKTVKECRTQCDNIEKDENLKEVKSSKGFKHICEDVENDAEHNARGELLRGKKEKGGSTSSSCCGN